MILGGKLSQVSAEEAYTVSELFTSCIQFAFLLEGPKPID